MKQECYDNYKEEYKELCKIFSLYAYEPITEHIYAEMVTLYKKVFMNIE